MGAGIARRQAHYGDLILSFSNPRYAPTQMPSAKWQIFFFFWLVTWWNKHLWGPPLGIPSKTMLTHQPYP